MGTYRVVDRLVGFLTLNCQKLFRAKLGGLKQAMTPELSVGPLWRLEAKSPSFGAWQPWVALGKVP